MYCMVRYMKVYILGSPGYLLQEVDVDCVQLGKVGLTLLGEEVVHIFLRLHLLHDLVDVDGL
jgi:hypothetical protein